MNFAVHSAVWLLSWPVFIAVNINAEVDAEKTWTPSLTDMRSKEFGAIRGAIVKSRAETHGVARRASVELDTNAS